MLTLLRVNHFSKQVALAKHLARFTSRSRVFSSTVGHCWLFIRHLLMPCIQSNTRAETESNIWLPKWCFFFKILILCFFYSRLFSRPLVCLASTLHLLHLSVFTRFVLCRHCYFFSSHYLIHTFASTPLPSPPCCPFTSSPLQTSLHPLPTRSFSPSPEVDSSVRSRALFTASLRPCLHYRSAGLL